MYNNYNPGKVSVCELLGGVRTSLNVLKNRLDAVSEKNKSLESPLPAACADEVHIV